MDSKIEFQLFETSQKLIRQLNWESTQSLSCWIDVQAIALRQTRETVPINVFIIFSETENDESFPVFYLKNSSELVNDDRTPEGIGAASPCTVVENTRFYPLIRSITLALTEQLCDSNRHPGSLERFKTRRRIEIRGVLDRYPCTVRFQSDPELFFTKSFELNGLDLSELRTPPVSILYVF